MSTNVYLNVLKWYFYNTELEISRDFKFSCSLLSAPSPFVQSGQKDHRQILYGSTAWAVADAERKAGRCGLVGGGGVGTEAGKEIPHGGSSEATADPAM